jgi:hypothetical protein
MKPRMTQGPSGCQANLDGLSQRERDKSLVLSLLRAAIDESKWKHAAIAAHLSKALDRKIDGPYLANMLSGVKSWSIDHLNALPDDVQRIYYRLRSESLQLIVVEPVDQETAARYMATALLSGVMPQLPARASAMAHADLRPVLQRRRVAAGEQGSR